MDSTIHQVTLYDCIPPPGVLPSVPAHLTLEYPLTNGEIQEAFWEFLACPSVAPADTKQDLPATIAICYIKNELFDWLDEIDLNYAVFIGRLLRVAVKLYKRGIVITDGYGLNVGSLTDA
jgi:hypothetical protein